MSARSRCELGIYITPEYSKTAYKYANKPPMPLDRSGGYGSDEVPMTLAWLEDEKRWMAGPKPCIDGHDDMVIYEGIYQQGATNEPLRNDGALFIHYLKDIVDYFPTIDPQCLIERVILIFKEGSGDEFMARIATALKDVLGCQVTFIRQSQAVANYVVSQQIEKACYLGSLTEAFVLFDIVKEARVRVKQIAMSKALSVNQLKVSLLEQMVLLYQAYVNKEQIDDLEKAALRELSSKYLPYLFKHYQKDRPMKIAVNHVFPPFQMVMDQETIKSIIEPFYNQLEEVLDQVEKYDGYTFIVEGKGFQYPGVMSLVKDHLKREVLLVEEASVLGAFCNEKGNNIWLEDYAESAYGVVVNDGSKDSFYCLMAKGDWLYQPPKVLNVIMEGTDENLILYEKQEDQALVEVGSLEMINNENQSICGYCVCVKVDTHKQITLAAVKQPI